LPPPHLYLVLRVYLGLGEIIPLPAPPPHEQLALAAGALPPAARGELEEIAGRFLDELRAALRGRDAFLPAAGPPDPALLRAIHDALRRDGELTLAYRPLGDRGDTRYEIRDTNSAGDPPPATCHLPLATCHLPLTVRRVRPLWLEQRGDLYYLHAYCYRAEAERVFRLDRVTIWD
jgi:predicted DNA-binding transcriptional regulator YafY